MLAGAIQFLAGLAQTVLLILCLIAFTVDLSKYKRILNNKLQAVLSIGYSLVEYLILNFYISESLIFDFYGFDDSLDLIS